MVFRKVGRTVRGEHGAIQLFFISISFILLVSLAGVFVAVAGRDTALIRDAVLERGRALYLELILVRRWVASYGGVYVVKKDGVDSNPWLEHPDLAAADGRTLTLRNPALVVREVSALADKAGDFRFHITSLKPLNPSNVPDPFERRSLEAFAKGKTETWEWLPAEGGREFRYMGVLVTENSCLSCHADQGYKEGDIRGGISVSFDVQGIERQLRSNIRSTALAAVVVVAVILALVWTLVSRLRKRLLEVRAELEKAAITDPLTGLYNRRHAMDRLIGELSRADRGDTPLCCALFDADFFKSVNDDFGHAKGDLVLQAIAKSLLEGTRPYDIVARWGGEEFLVILPRAGLRDAFEVCERIRKSVALATDKALGGARRVTVSAGVSTFAQASDRRDFDTEAAIHDLIQRADAALYRAKSAGRDRCEME